MKQANKQKRLALDSSRVILLKLYSNLLSTSEPGIRLCTVAFHKWVMTSFLVSKCSQFKKEYLKQIQQQCLAECNSIWKEVGTNAE